MRVRDIMTPHPACCTPNATLADVARVMLRQDCGSVPICDDQGHVLGVVTDRDIAIRAVAADKDPRTCRVSEIMSHPVALIQEGQDVAAAIALMESNQVRRAPVVDERGCVVGMLAQADVARNAPDQVGGLVQQVSTGDYGHVL